MPTIPMIDVSDATYTRGSFHVNHNEIAYLNYDLKTSTPHVFSSSSLGELTHDGLKIRTGKQIITLPEAKIYEILIQEPVKNTANGSTAFEVCGIARHTEGTFELTYKDETYFLVSDHPIPHALPEQNLFASLEGDRITMRILNQGHVHTHRFERKSPCASLKRHLLDEDALTRYTFAEKRAETLRKNAAKVAEIAKRALEAVKERPRTGARSTLIYGTNRYYCI